MKRTKSRQENFEKYQQSGNICSVGYWDIAKAIAIWDSGIQGLTHGWERWSGGSRAGVPLEGQEVCDRWW